MSNNVTRLISAKLNSNLWDIKLVLYITVLFTVFNTVHVAYLEGYAEAERIFSQQQISGDSIRVTQNRIAILLIISCIGLLSRTLIGFIVSALSLTYAVKEFSSWYYHTAVNVRPYYPDWDVGLLAGGTWWDVTIMIVVLALLAWQVFTVASSFQRRHVY